MNTKSLTAALTMLLAGSTLLAADEGLKKDKFDFLLGVNFIISPDYNDWTDDAYPGYDSSGGFGWIGFLLGLECKVTDRFSVIGGCGINFNSVDVTGGVLDESYINWLLLPAVNAQYYITESRSFYVNAGIGLPIPSTGSDYYEFNGNGVSLSVNVGFAFGYDKRSKIELGYSVVPVEVEATPENPVLSGSEDYNFGGFQARVIYAF